MKKIICYGDSNTFGYNPVDASRYDENTRWTALLKRNLEKTYDVINEGVSDRTGFVNNPKGFLYSAPKHFPKMLASINDVDVIILAIGTNDLQFQYDISFGAVEKGLENLINLAQEKANHIIIIPPVILSDNVLKGYFSCQFDETGIVKSRKIGRIYRKLANVHNCLYFDINKFAVPSDFDGLHYDEKAHTKIAENLTKFIQGI